MYTLFISIEKRNKYAKELQANGFRVKKSSMRNKLIHPMYIEDFQKRFSNDYGARRFKVLYEVGIIYPSLQGA